MNSSGLFIVLVIAGIIFALIGSGICQLKGRSFGEGFILGLILGIFGIMIVAALPENKVALETTNIKDGTGKLHSYRAEPIKRET